MATQYDPIAKDKSLNTTEATPRNIADVLAEELSGIASALTPAQLNSLSDVTISSPSDGQTLKYNSVTQKWENANDAGGHIIENPSGTDMTQRANLQFVDAGVSDDSGNNRTKIEILQEISTESDLNSAPDGMYQGTWDEDPDGVLTADMVGYGSGTVEDALDDLTATTLAVDDGTSLSNGVEVTITAQSDGYLIAYTTNSDTFIQISPVSDFSVSFTVVKNASGSTWSFDYVYLRKGMTVYVKATGTHGYYRFCSIS